MVLANKKLLTIFKYGILRCHFEDLSSLIQNLYKYLILALVKKSQNIFEANPTM